MESIPGLAAYLAACACLLGLASLNVLISRRLVFWRLSVVTTEFGHWLFVPAAALAGIGLRQPWPGAAYFGAAAVGIAGLLFLAPLCQAWFAAAGLPDRMEEAFGPLPADAPALPTPFSWRTLLFGRKTPPVPVRSFAYAERSGDILRLDFHRAPAGPPVPCIVLVHGGGWNSGSPREGAEFDAFLARRGYAVAAIQYRLAPAATWPAPREDLYDALRWLKAHAGELGIDPERFVLLGRSAGGQIAEAAAYAEGAPFVRGCIAFYAPSDMFFSLRYAKPGDILDSPRLILDYLGGGPEEKREAYGDASGLLLVKKGRTPPTLLLHGRHDPLVWFLQSERLARRLRDAGVPHARLDLRWATHAFDYDRRTPGGQIAAYAVLRFLAAVTAPGP